MAYALIVSTGKTGSVHSTTTDAIDTTGANLIVVTISWYAVVTVDTVLTDSKSNTWVPMTASRNMSGNAVSTRMFYCFNPTAGSGHTFTSAATSTYAAVLAMAFSGSVASPLDQENGNTSASTNTLNTGSVTPSENNELVLATVCDLVGVTHTIDSGFTAVNVDAAGSASCGGGMAYKIQTSLGAENPTWSWTNAEGTATAIATFKAAAAAAMRPMMANNEG